MCSNLCYGGSQLVLCFSRCQVIILQCCSKVWVICLRIFVGKCCFVFFVFVWCSGVQCLVFCMLFGRLCEWCFWWLCLFVGISRVCSLVKLLVLIWLIEISLLRVFFSLLCSRWVFWFSLLKNDVFCLCSIFSILVVCGDSFGFGVLCCRMFQSFSLWCGRSMIGVLCSGLLVVLLCLVRCVQMMCLEWYSWFS